VTIHSSAVTVWTIALHALSLKGGVSYVGRVELLPAHIEFYVVNGR